MKPTTKNAGTLIMFNLVLSLNVHCSFGSKYCSQTDESHTAIIVNPYSMTADGI